MRLVSVCKWRMKNIQHRFRGVGLVFLMVLALTALLVIREKHTSCRNCTLYFTSLTHQSDEPKSEDNSIKMDTHEGELKTDDMTVEEKSLKMQKPVDTLQAEKTTKTIENGIDNKEEVILQDVQHHATGIRMPSVRRSSSLSEACKTFRAANVEQMSGRNYSVNFVTDDQHKVVFCEIFKCASTFWKDILNKKVKPAKVLEGHKPDWFRFMFVREPYKRFMSFYVDKLYTPNTEFWRMFSHWIPRCRNSKTKRKGCCEDVTFNELLEFVLDEIKHKRPLDPHLTPMHEHCHPCERKFDFIGRMENFTHDAYRVFEELNSRTETKIIYDDFRKESNMAAAKDYVYRLFRTKVWVNRCLPMYDAMLRTWKALQIRGIIDSRIQMPFPREGADRLSKFTFHDAVMKALQQSTDRDHLKKAKSEAVRELFSTVNRDVLHKIQDVVRPDCELFGYDPEPEDIFSSEKSDSAPFYFVSLDETQYRKYFGGDPSKLPSARIQNLMRMVPGSL